MPTIPALVRVRPARYVPRRAAAVALAAAFAGGLAPLPAADAAPTAHAARAAKPDLKVASLGTPPSTVVAGSTFTQKLTLRSTGATAKSTATGFWLSLDGKLDKGDVALGTAAAKAIKAGKTLATSAKLTVPKTTKSGNYRLIACADGPGKLRERNEKNNCAVSKKAIRVTAALSGSGGNPGSGGTSTPPGGSQPGGDPNQPGPNPGGNPGDQPGPGNPGDQPGDTTPSTTPSTDPIDIPGDGKPGRSGTPTPLDPGATQSLRDSTAFLYTGPNAPQQGVAPGTISERRVAVLRGKVTDKNGVGLPGVAIAILDHPEFGRSTTRADGGYDFVVNGGGPVVINFNRSGYLRSQRTVATAWQQYAFVDDVVLLPLDPKVSTIDPDGAAAISVAQGTETSDGDGDRQASLLFAKGTDVTAKMPDGTTKPIDGPIHVRATEYTQGGDGINAMPGSLPNTSGYTYAAEFTVDEAAGATSVKFDKPVIDYTQNFIGAPVGSNVPTGWYDREKGRWIPSKNGRVIKVLSITGGAATVDVTGDGIADTGTALTALGITDAELTKLATLYPAGQELWRVAIDHFTPWDHNWPYGPDPDAVAPNVDDTPASDPPKDPCEQNGSIIGCESQTLGERIPIPGTHLSLDYRSDRQSGWLGSQTVDIPLVGDSVPNKLRGVQVDVDVAGKRYETRFTGLTPGQRMVFDDWDGKDAYGRIVNGEVPVSITLKYVYKYLYYASNDAFEASFARFGDNLEQFSGRDSCGTAATGAFDCGFALSQSLTRKAKISSPWNAKASGSLGGWTLSAQHAYDPTGHVVHMGDGTDQTGTNAVGSVAGTSSVLAGNPNGPEGTAGDGKQATAVDIDYLDAMATGPDGSIYLHAGLNHNLIRRVFPDGHIATIGGAERVVVNGNVTVDHSGDLGGEGQQAKGSILGTGVSGLAVAPDGTVYFGVADKNSNHYIRKIAPNGILTTIAGIPDHSGFGDSGEGGPAIKAKVGDTRELAVAPDGAVWFSETSGNTNGFKAGIRRIDPSSGILTTEVGGGTTPIASGDTGAGTPARKLSIGTARGLSFANDGSLLFGQPTAHVVEKLSGDGIVRRIAGNGTAATTTAGITFGKDALATAIGDPVNAVQAPDGTIYVRTRGAADNGDDVIVAFGASGGAVRPIAGAVHCEHAFSFTMGPLAPAEECIGSHANGLGVAGDGNPLWSNGRYQVRRVHDPMPGFGEGSLAIPSQDGQSLFEFDANGRHERTVSAMDASVQEAFEYDDANRLVKITDGDGNATTIERDAAGKPTAIVAPGGQKTTLAVDANGMLSEVKDPTGHATKLGYDGASGLLTKYTDPGSGEHTMKYDTGGRLTKDSAPDGTVKTLTRGSDAEGVYVTLTTKEGRATKYSSTRLPDGTVVRKEVDPAGATSTTVQRPDGTTSMTSPSGQKVALEFTGDPRFGMQSPYIGSMSITTPGGRKETLTDVRTANLTDPLVPSTLTAFHDVRSHHWTANGSDRSTSSRTDYDRATRSTKVTSPEGRTSTTVTDAKGHATSVKIAGQAEQVLSYDDQGRLAKVVHGEGSSTYAYDDAGRLKSTTDALDHQTKYGYDDAGRLTSLTSPGGHTYEFGYDADGNRTTIKTPRGKIHHLAYTPGGKLASYKTPLGHELAAGFDGDALNTSVTRPDGSSLALGRDAGGRGTGVIPSPAGQPQYATSYVGGDDRVEHDRTLAAGGNTVLQDIASAYDGDQLTSVAYSGAAAGTYTYGYNDQFRLDDMKLVSGADTVDTEITRDDDGRITALGGFAITAGGPGGATSAISDSKLADVRGFDSVGRMNHDGVTVATHPVYDLALTRDQAGHLTQRVEKIGANTVTWVNTYDADGQLKSVTRNGVNVGTYAYDDDGNRTSAGATYDDDGVQTGGSGVQADVNGTMTHRGAWTFSYGAAGELLSATDGTKTITYTYDATGHLVGRDEGADHTSYLYGDPGNPDQVTASRGADGQLVTYLYGEDGRMFALKRGATQFYVGSDQVGNVRIVTDSSGAIVHNVEYDPWGKHLSETGALVIPIGFAGAVEDPATGLVRMGQRWYDPNTGRFTTRDPTLLAGGQLNFFAYVGNDPVGHVDANGLEWYNNWNDFNSSLNTNVGQPVHDFVADNWHTIVHYGEKIIGDSAPATVLKKGDSALDTASEIGDTYIEVQEALDEPNQGKSAAGLMQCILKAIDKLPLPWNPVKPAGEVLKTGVDIVDGYQGMGSKNSSNSFDTRVTFSGE